MRQQTRELLRAMDLWPWFGHVGEPVDSPEIIPVNNWDQAIELCDGALWESVTLAFSNIYFDRLQQEHWEVAQRWNPICVEVKHEMAGLVEHIREFSETLANPGSFLAQVQWDILLTCVETEFSDVLPPFFSVPVLLPWYRIGHFPCGWDGPDPELLWDNRFLKYKLFVY